MARIWTHGTTAVAENVGPGGLRDVREIPYSNVVGMRGGAGAVFRGEAGRYNWFHFSLPVFSTFPLYNYRVSPPRHQDYQVELFKVIALLLIANAEVNAVHVWDGTERVAAFAPSLTGTYDHSYVNEVPMATAGAGHLNNVWQLGPGGHDTDERTKNRVPIIQRSVGVSVGVQFDNDVNPWVHFISVGGVMCGPVGLKRWDAVSSQDDIDGRRSGFACH
jgi:hypothetical protein